MSFSCGDQIPSSLARCSVRPHLCSPLFKAASSLSVALADRYRIERGLGGGGMAIVRRAWDRDPRRGSRQTSSARIGWSVR
jgi:hypothetical protein